MGLAFLGLLVHILKDGGSGLGQIAWQDTDSHVTATSTYPQCRLVCKGLSSTANARHNCFVEESTSAPVDNEHVALSMLQARGKNN